MKESYINILGNDAGHKNWAVASLRVRNDGKYKILKSFMLKNTLVKVNTAPEDLIHLLSEFRDIVPPERETYLVIERFMGRGSLTGVTAEIVNIAIGGLLADSYVTKANPVLLTAAGWKNAVNRKFSLNLLYKSIAAPPHIIDAVCMSIYYGHIYYGITPFSDWSENRIFGLKTNIEKSYIGRQRSIRNLDERILDLMKSLT